MMDFKELELVIEELLDENEALIYEEYNGKSDQILIDAKLVAKLQEALKTRISDNNLQKETLKKILRDILQLEPQDLLIFKNGHIFIKLVSELEQKIPEGRQSSNEARYNGYDEKELIAFYNDFFTDEDVTALIEKVAEKFIKKYIIQKSISNDEYEKKVFAYIKELFYEFLQKRFENQDEFLLGFAGYIFRINFERVFTRIAEIMLEKMAKGNQKIGMFLEYYSNEVIIQNGQKYQVPPIVSKNGHRWKIVSIIPIVRVYFSTLESIVQLKQKIETLKKETIKFGAPADGTSLLDQQKAIKLRIQSLTNELNDKLNTIEKMYNEVLTQNLSPTEKRELKKRITFEKNEADKIKSEKKRLEKMLLPSGTLASYQKVQRELDALKRELRNKQRLLEQNAPSYEEIKAALVRALIQKKRKITS